MQSSTPGPWGRFSATCADVAPSGALVYDLSGTFADCREAYEFLDDLRGRVGTGSGPIVLDLAAVHHMTSSGVGIVAACFTSAMNAGRPLRLAAMSRRVENIMRIVGLLAVIPRYASREEALAEPVA